MSEPPLLFPLATPQLGIVGSSAVFPVGRIFCVGRNYAAHAREMGADPNAEPPLFFMKPASAAICAPAHIPYPRDTTDLHHEVELVLALDRGGSDIDFDQAKACIFGYAVGVDLTKRDRQSEAKEKGHPWERAKAFDASAPISAIRPVLDGEHTDDAHIRLSVNGKVRQHANIADMIWPAAAIIGHLSRIWRLCAGDLIFTGTPEGVGAIPLGARVEAVIDGVGALDFTVGDSPA